MAAAGARVGALARRADRLDELVAALPGSGHAAATADVTEPAALAAALDDLVGRLAVPVAGVVAAAGVMSLGSVADTDPDRWRALLDVNVTGLLATARAALAHLDAGGTLVVVSSMSGRRVATAAGGVYAASKHAAHAVAETLRLEAGPRGVRVTTLSPGFVATDLVGSTDEAAASTTDRPLRRAHARPGARARGRRGGRRPRARAATARDRRRVRRVVRAPTGIPPT